MAILALRRESLVLNGVTITRYLSKAITVWLTTDTHTITSCSGPKNWQRKFPRGQPLKISAIRSGARRMATRRSEMAIFIINMLHGVHRLRFPQIVAITMVLPMKPASITNASKLTKIMLKTLFLPAMGDTVVFPKSGKPVALVIGGKPVSFAIGRKPVEFATDGKTDIRLTGSITMIFTKSAVWVACASGRHFSYMCCLTSARQSSWAWKHSKGWQRITYKQEKERVQVRRDFLEIIGNERIQYDTRKCYYRKCEGWIAICLSRF